jgi:hypothetical protein
MAERPQVVPCACTVAVTVGMAVAFSVDVDRTVEPTQVANLAAQPPVGVCVELLGSGWALVQTGGLTEALWAGLAEGEILYAGNDGALVEAGTHQVAVAVTAAAVCIGS